MTLIIEARPRSPALDAAAVRRLAGTLAGWAARAAARRGRASDFGAVTLCFVGPAAIARIHRQALGLPGETDVVTLAYAAAPGATAAAEIFVNPALALRRGADRVHHAPRVGHRLRQRFRAEQYPAEQHQHERGRDPHPRRRAPV